MNVKFSIFIIGLILCAGIAVGISMQLTKVPVTAVVDLKILWEDFEMRKELQTELDGSIEEHSKRLDEMKMQLANQMVEAGSGEVKDASIYNRLIGETRRIESEITYLTETEAFELENSIKVRMKEYLKEFCHKEGISLLISTSDVDPVIYYEGALDLTQKASDFINSKYLGK